jgi:hypothetical protein
MRRECNEDNIKTGMVITNRITKKLRTFIVVEIFVIHFY